MTHYTALYDACVLYPAPLRDLLMELAVSDLYRARWTAEIHEEWIRSVLKERKDLKEADLRRTASLMDQNVRDCLIEGYETLIPALSLPDPDDRHVLAAAIKGRANVIVTYNLKDFPPEILDTYEIEALHPDEFIAYQADLAPTKLYEAAKMVRARLKQPPKTVEEYIDTLGKQQLPKTVAFLCEAKPLL